MDCLLCYKVFIKEKEFRNCSLKPEVYKKAILFLFGIARKPDVQGLSEDLIVCMSCHRKLEKVEDLVDQFEELQRKMEEARIAIKNDLVESKEANEAMAKNTAANRMSPSSLDRLIILKAIEGQDTGCGGNVVQKEDFDELDSVSVVSFGNSLEQLDQIGHSDELQREVKGELEENEFERRFQAIKKDRMSRHQRVNQVKNLEGTSDDEQLRKEFQGFGGITSPKGKSERSMSMSSFGSSVGEVKRRVVGTKPAHVELTRRDEDPRAHLSSPNMHRSMNKSKISSPPLSPVYTLTGSHSSIKQATRDQMSPTQSWGSPQTRGFGIQTPHPPARASAFAAVRPNDDKMFKIFPLIHEKCQRSFAVAGRVAEIMLEDYAWLLNRFGESDCDLLDSFVETALLIIHMEDSSKA